MERKSHKGFVNEHNARAQSAERAHYQKVIEGIAARGVCPFCSEHVRLYHKRPLEEGTYWWTTESMYPYHPVRHHLLFIHKKHIENVSDISDAGWRELHALVKKNVEKRKIRGGSIMLRFGDTHFTGASVAHLHAHLIQSDPAHADYPKEKKIATGVAARVG